uniref:hypothetical protein n=1 Tax=Luteimonas sp. 4-12 TaxID=2027406 RepID=UPI001E53D3DC|nr:MULTISPECIES: hypothetical protein [Luteimonas]
MVVEIRVTANGCLERVVAVEGVPVIQIGRGDAMQAAQRPYRGGFRMVGDEGEDVGLGLEVNAMAFLKVHARPATARTSASLRAAP